VAHQTSIEYGKKAEFMSESSLISFRPYLLDPVPVTVVSGLPGAGKSELIRQMIEFLAQGAPPKKANLLDDAKLMKPDASCSHCGVTDALQDEFKRQIREECPDQFFVEVPIEVDPRMIMSSFPPEVQRQYQRREPGSRARPTRPASLDALVTVIDASTFVKRMNSQNSLAADFPGLKTTEPEALNDATVDLLAASIETCDVLLVHRFESLSSDFMLSLQSCLRALQPRAKIVLAAEGKEALWIPEVLDTRLFDLEKTEGSSTWRQALKKCPPESRTAPGSEAGGWLPVEMWPGADPDLWCVGIFRRFRPFHPKRLADSLDHWTDDLLRTVGQIWLATDGGHSYHLGQIGPSPVFFHPDAPWAVTAPLSDQLEMRREEPELDRIWDSGHGDRFTEIVLIGPQAVIQEAVHELDLCLLTDAEMTADWTKFDDPFFEEMQAQEKRERASISSEEGAGRRPPRERANVPWLKLVPPSQPTDQF